MSDTPMDIKPRTLDSKAGHISTYLLVAAVASIVTSWALKTPELHKKAETLAVVEQKTLPSALGQLAKAKTQLKQSDCDKQKITQVAVRGILADKSPAVSAPDWDDLQGCSKVAPVKPIPVAALIPRS